MDISHFLGLLAGITALVTYFFYFKQVIKNRSTPNPATWIIWVIVGLINLLTFFSVTGNNWWQSFIVIAVFFCMLGIFLYSILRGKISKISVVGYISLILAIIIVGFWQITSNYRISNLLLQGIYVISYIPTGVGIIRGTVKEYHIAWIIAFFAYVFSIGSIWTGPPADWIAYAHPVINGLFGNGIIVALMFYKNWKYRVTPNNSK